MDERLGSPLRVAYLTAGGASPPRELTESEPLRVDPVSDTESLRTQLSAADCVVIVHDGADDDFALLDRVQSATVDRPVIVVTDPDLADAALDAGATDVVGATLPDVPVSVLTHRIQQAVTEAERDGHASTLTRSVLNTLSDVVYVLDTEGAFQQWNNKLLDMTVYGGSALAGMELPELVVPDDRATLTEAIESATTDGVTETREAALVTAVGDRVTYEFNITPLTDADDRVVGLAGTAREVTEQKLREQRLAVVTRVLRHNVRNRMTVVKGRTEQLETEFGDDVNLTEIRAAAAELVELSDKARRVEAALRESSANRRVLDVVDIAETTLAALRREYPDVELVLNAPDVLNARTTDGLTFALEELVRNGVVHNDTDSPCVRVTIEETAGEDTASEETNPDMVRITVVDNGPGIPEAERVALTTGHETDLEHATGLGLWLVNWIVTAAGGELACGSCDDLGGAKVTLRFPAAGR